MEGKKKKKLKSSHSYMWFSFCRQTYRRMRKDLSFIFGLWPDLAKFSRDDRHFFYIFQWMIATLATKQKFLRKELYLERGLEFFFQKIIVANYHSCSSSFSTLWPTWRLYRLGVHIHTQASDIQWDFGRWVRILRFQKKLALCNFKFQIFGIWGTNFLKKSAI